MKKTIAIIAVLFSMSACVSHFSALDHVDPVKDASLVAIYIDMEQAPSRAEWGWIKAVKPINGKVNFRLSHVEGDKFKTILFAQNIPPGEYYLEKIAGQTDETYRKNFSYTLGSKKSPLVKFKVTKQGVYYLGSYKYIHVKSKFGKKSMDDFHFEAAKKVKSKDVLRELASGLNNKKLRAMVESSVQGG